MEDTIQLITCIYIWQHFSSMAVILVIVCLMWGCFVFQNHISYLTTFFLPNNSSLCHLPFFCVADRADIATILLTKKWYHDLQKAKLFPVSTQNPLWVFRYPSIAWEAVSNIQWILYPVSTSLCVHILAQLLILSMILPGNWLVMKRIQQK